MNKVDFGLKVGDGRTQSHDWQINVEHVYEESDEGRAQGALASIAGSGIPLQDLPKRNCRIGHIDLPGVLLKF
jgi:hypothetical protein